MQRCGGEGCEQQGVEGVERGRRWRCGEVSSAVQINRAHAEVWGKGCEQQGVEGVERGRRCRCGEVSSVVLLNRAHAEVWGKGYEQQGMEWVKANFRAARRSLQHCYTPDKHTACSCVVLSHPHKLPLQFLHACHRYIARVCPCMCPAACPLTQRTDCSHPHTFQPFTLSHTSA